MKKQTDFQADSLLAFERRHCFATAPHAPAGLGGGAPRDDFFIFFFDLMISRHGKSKLDLHVNLSVGR